MLPPTFQILLIEDNSGDARLIQEMLIRTEGGKFEIEWVTRLREGLERLGRGGIDVVLLDLGLPDSQGLETFIKAAWEFPQVPFVVLTGLADEEVGVNAVRQGAQDYLIKGEVDGKLLFRSIRYATQRKQAEAEIKDREEELTAIYENAPVCMMLVDSERRVRKINQIAARFAGASPGDLIGRRGGEALRCLHALEVQEGCGFGPYCQKCTVRRTVRDTLETGESHHQVEASLPFLAYGKSQEVAFLLNTVRLSIRGEYQVLVTIQDITKIKEAEKNIRHLSHELLRTQEQEKHKIALELHDTVAQDLATLKIGLDNLRRSLEGTSSGELSLRFVELSETLQNTLNSIRTLSNSLRPPDLEHLGLVQALRAHCEEVALRSGLRIDFKVAGLEAIRFNDEDAINLYRIIQEGLANARHHARAKNVAIRLVASHPWIIVRLEDDGQGFDVAAQAAYNQQDKRLGLLGMKERVAFLGGEMQLESQLNKGTKIKIEIPWSGESHGAEEKDTAN